jgi:metal-sulfur cluster biosynthetic enzyme
MSITISSQTITQALEKVEHPAIAATLLNLGTLRGIDISSREVTLTLVLPFPNIVENVRDYMVNSLDAAAQSAGGELTKVHLAVMDHTERQSFLTKEQQNWRNKR